MIEGIVDKGYVQVLERFSQKGKPYNPWIIIDATGNIRHSSDDFASHFGYSDKELREAKKPFLEYLATDVYESELAGLSARINAVLARELPRGIVAERLMKFRGEHHRIRKDYGVEEKILQIAYLAKELLKKPVDEKNEPILSSVRVKRKDGTCVTLEDDIWLCKRLEGETQHYAGAVVTLHVVKNSFAKFARKTFDKVKEAGSALKLREREIPTYETNESFVLDYLASSDDSKYFLQRLSQIETNKPLVLDCTLIPAFDKTAAELFFPMASGMASASKFIIGNASKELQQYVSSVDKRAQFVNLQYAQKPYNQLNAEIREHLRSLAEKLQHADFVPRTSVSEVPSNS